jgi:hypothetical protein
LFIIAMSFPEAIAVYLLLGKASTAFPGFILTLNRKPVCADVFILIKQTVHKISSNLDFISKQIKISIYFPWKVYEIAVLRAFNEPALP